MNNVKGGLVYKQKILARAPEMFIGMVATRHANGRDWWIISNCYNCGKSDYFIIFLGKDTTYVKRQQIGQRGFN